MWLIFMKRQLTVIYAIHGFLGLPSDWNQLNVDHKVIACKLSPTESLHTWSEQFNQSVANNTDERRILLGYSMGGRLAMHALLENSSLWHGAIIVSAHPGLTSNEEKCKKLISDHAWANRFEVESWRKLVQDWNAQKIFVDDPGLQRNESEFSRNDLSHMLRHWSLGHQENLLPKLSKLHIPMLYVAGENDAKYVDVAQEFSKSCHRAKLWIAPEASHRVPWQKPKLFQQQIIDFINRT